MSLDSLQKDQFRKHFYRARDEIVSYIDRNGVSEGSEPKAVVDALLVPVMESFQSIFDCLTERIGELQQQNIRLKEDIADVRFAEEALKESEQKFRALAQTAHEAILSADCSGNILFWNRGAEIMFGYESHEIIGKHISMLVPDDTFNHLLENVQQVIAREAENVDRAHMIEALGKRKDSSNFPAEISLSSWQSRDATYYTAIIREVTKRKKAEMDLAKEKELLDVTLRSTGDGIISTDTEGRILLINGVAEKLLGIGAKEIIGKNLQEKFHSIDTFAEIAQSAKSVVSEGKGIDGEISTGSGRNRRTIIYTATPMRASTHEIIGTVLALQDITERRRMEEELFRARKLEAIGVLAGGIAHDFNNILTGIITNLFMVKTGLKTDSEPHTMITDAEKAAFKASKLTNRLLTFAKGGAPVKENASIRELIEDSVGFCLSGSSIECDLKVDENLWGVEIDRGQIDQVLNNLLINAKQSMPNGGTITVFAQNMEIHDEISDATEAIIPLLPGKYLKISISDTGKGISRDNLSKIFDPYFTTSSKRNGLGLSTVYSIIRKHNGFITAKSRLGQGTTFMFYLPAVREEDGQFPETVPKCTGTKRILVMDDDEVIRAVVDRILKNAGYYVETVTNGADALHLYCLSMKRKKKFNLVLMDITIPGGMGGKQTVGELLSIDPEAKVIASSGYLNDPVMTNYRDYGFVDVLPKPFNVAKFMHVIASVTNT